MTVQAPAWPRATGSSLLLVPIAHTDEEWAPAEGAVRTAIEELGIAVVRGLSHCPPYVRTGAEAVTGDSAKDVLLFACPADIGVFEAAPLVTAAESGTMLGEVASFFRRASEVALTMAPKIAWVVAHAWTPEDRVRWDSGDIDCLVRFSTSPGAWRTQFLVARPRHIFESDEWPYWFEVTRGEARR